MADDLTPSGENLRGVSTTEAFLILDELAATGKLTLGQVDTYKESYSALHELVQQSYKREDDLLSRAKELHDSLVEENITLEKLTIHNRDDARTVADLDKKKEEVTINLRELEDKDNALRIKVKELELEEKALTDETATLTSKNAEIVEPVLSGLRAEIEAFEKEIENAEALAANLMKTKQSLIDKTQAMQEEISVQEEAKTVFEAEYQKAKADPERIKKQAEKFRKACEDAEGEVSKLKSRIGECDAALAHQDQKKKELEEKRQRVDAKLRKFNDDIDKRQRDADAVQRNLNYEKDEYQKLLSKRIELDMEITNKENDLKRLANEHNLQMTLYQRAKKELKRRQYLADSAKGELPLAKNQLVDANHSVRNLADHTKSIEDKYKEVDQEVKLQVYNYIQQEKLQIRKRKALEEMLAIEAELEQERENWRIEESIAKKQIGALTAQRELKARELAKAQANEKAADEELKMKSLLVRDLEKKAGEVAGRLKEFSNLYEIVKNERNAKVNGIQMASQALAEMRERVKILHNEVEILKNESNAKKRALESGQQKHATLKVQRDALRQEANKLHAIYRERQAQVEQQIVEIEKLNTIINQMEREMIALKKKYEKAVEARNFTGIQLIDRNDELCILYEKSNVHEDTLKKGELRMRDLEEDIRMLAIHASELQREIQVVRKTIPEMPKLAENILTLQQSLAAEREVTEKLCLDLETPENDARWRQLGGEDPDPDQIAEKIEVLEQRLSQVKQQILEKDLVLEEVTALSNRLESEASKDRGSTLRRARDVNSFQVRIREVNRKMMALVSELSMYKATTLKLQHERESREEELTQAIHAVRRGEPPTPDAEQEWFRRERDRIRKLEETEKKARETAHSQAGLLPSQLTRTTAEPRPNAYIPDEIGIPKPYGVMAPFKPSIPGTTMRHIRNPVPKEIEI